MIIKVTKKHIKLGINKMVDTHNCPVGRALTEAGFYHVNVGMDNLFFGATENRKMVSLPKKARDFINTAIFNPEKAKPFSFRIKDPRK